MLSTDLLETSILQYMEKLPTEDGRTLWQCTLCGKHHHLKHVISDHVEALHLSDIEFECPYCQKKKKSRSNLRAHISTYHREEHQMSKHSDFLWWTKGIVCLGFEIYQLITTLTNFHLFVQPIGVHDIFISFAPSVRRLPRRLAGPHDDQDLQGGVGDQYVEVHGLPKGTQK